MKKCFILSLILFLYLTFTYGANSGEWQELPEFTGGDVFSLGMDSSGTIYAGTKTGFVYKSTDEGENWSYFSEGLEEAFHAKSNINHFTYLKNGILAASAKGQGIFVNDLNNPNSNWHKLDFSTANPDFLTIQADGNFIYAITNKSNQIDFYIIEHISGTDFNITGKNYPGLLGDLIVADNDRIYIIDANEKGLYYTDDQGETWQNDEENFVDSDLFWFAPGRSKSEFFVLVWDYNLYLTQDNGISWDLLTDSDDLSGVFVYNALFLSDGSIMLFSNHGIYIGDDTGNNWELVNSEVFSFIQIELDGIVYSTKEKKAVYKSTDKGESWNEKKQGMTSLSILDMTEGKDSTLFAVSSKHIYRLLKDTDEWELISDEDSPPFNYTIAKISLDDILYFGTDVKRLIISSDDGNTLESVNIDLGNPYYVKDLIFLPNDNIIMHCRDNAYNVLISKDLGYTWDYFELSNIPEEITNNFYMSIAADSSNGVYVGALNNFIFQSFDEGQSWNHFNDLSATPYDIEINSFFDIFCIAYNTSVQHKIYFSTDQGASWESIDDFQGNSTTTIKDIAVHKNKILVNISSDVYHTDDIYISEDWGDTWEKISDDNMPYINKLYFKYDYLYACTTKGIYRYSEEIVSVEDQPKKVNNYKIYPNPVKNVLFIDSFTEITDPEISINTLEGQEIKRVNYENSLNHLQINVNEIPAGVYMIKIRTFDKIKTFLFIKE